MINNNHIREYLDRKMEDLRFKEGQEINGINLNNENSIIVGEYGVERITVIMENGQMIGVPWFAVWSGGRVISKHNAALIVSVML